MEVSLNSLRVRYVCGLAKLFQIFYSSPQIKKKKTQPKKKAAEPKPKKKISPKKPAAAKAKTTPKKKKKQEVSSDEENGAADSSEEDFGFEEDDDNGKDTPKKKKTIEEQYKKLDQIEHALQRPDMYIGAAQPLTAKMWVYDKVEGMIFKKITYTPGLYKIFDEILVNAADNKQRDVSMRYIKVDIDAEKGYITVCNDGKGKKPLLHFL